MDGEARCRELESGYTLVELMAAVAITLFVMAGIYGLMIQNQQIYEKQTQLSDVQQAARVALDMMTRDIRMAGGDPSRRAFTNVRAACMTGGYILPVDAKNPDITDVAPLTVAKTDNIRIKADKNVFVLGPEPTNTTATPAPNPAPLIDLDSDSDFIDDDENLLGDGFIDDAGEDIEYRLDTASKRLLRVDHRDVLPNTTCRYAGAPGTIPPPAGEQRIAENVVKLELKYYSTTPPTPPDSATYPCPPAGVYPTEAAYEAARDICDPPLAFTGSSKGGGTGKNVLDLSAVQRVRLKIVVETERKDPLKTKSGPTLGKNWITLTSEITIRNRVAAF